MGKEKIGTGTIPDAEKDAAIGLLITVFESHGKEKVLYKALDDFSAVYGDDIPEWMQHLYGYLRDSGNADSKMDVIRNFAEQHKMEIIV